jgi:hypothetical protein
MAVDPQLHNPSDALDRESENPKRGLKGASGGIYVGPTRPNAGDTNTSHATGAAAGGVEDSTGYRKRDGYQADNGATAAFTTNTRPTGRTAYTAPGVQGGSPLDGGAVDGAAIDNRAVEDGTGGRALGMDGRGTQYVGVGDGIASGAADPKGVGVTAAYDKNPRKANTALIPRPTLGAADGPAAGTVAVIAGDDKLTADLHADDVTGGANGLAGAEVFLYRRGTDTDEDGDFVAKADFDSTTAGDLFTGLITGTTYAIYARFKDAAGNVGPLSARGTVATT